MLKRKIFSDFSQEAEFLLPSSSLGKELLEEIEVNAQEFVDNNPPPVSPFTDKQASSSLVQFNISSNETRILNLIEKQAEEFVEANPPPPSPFGPK